MLSMMMPLGICRAEIVGGISFPPLPDNVHGLVDREEGLLVFGKKEIITDR
jgi:hypothetical protein